MRWIDAMRKAITDLCSAKSGKSFSRQDLLQYLEQIKHDAHVSPEAKTPEETMSYYLQKLRDKGEVEFVDYRGHYKVIGGTLALMLSERERGKRR